ncbi:hypothetical protein HAPAU_31430 [Halalkalicoccus paucihalophilus]|uniref:Uncharacterized protein n=1 Tax=Halalkalicoccus paucihalophilus TaxID=1008153 RepID=A0A151AAN7_9EURY|nr:hypothetical protein HAPAU_31430 [Halalkalicoccus paucihalophilus]
MIDVVLLGIFDDYLAWSTDLNGSLNGHIVVGSVIFSLLEQFFSFFTLSVIETFSPTSLNPTIGTICRIKDVEDGDFGIRILL